MKIILLILAVSIFAHGQTSNQKSTTQVPSESVNLINNEQVKKIERIEVVGSRIKRIVKEGTTSVGQIKKETIKNSANVKTAEALRDSAASMTGSQDFAYTAVSTIALRGIGAERTLVLLNGRRLPTDPYYDAVDLNWIPAAAIEKIEILKDGASALYGSDAIGGVVNIVTKKGFTGSEASLKLSTTEQKGGTAYTASAMTGINTEKQNFNIAFGYSHADKILGRNREITRKGLSATGPAAAWKGLGQSKYTVPQVSDCPAENIRIISGNQRCIFRFNELATTRPHVNEFNLLSDYTFRLGSDLKIYNQTIAIYRETEWTYAPYPVNIVPQSFKPTPFPSGIPSNPNVRALSFRPLELGNRNNRDTDFNFNTVLGLKGNLTPDLEYDISSTYGEINQKQRGSGGYVNEALVKDAILTGVYDPLQPIGSRGNLNSALVPSIGNLNQKLFSTELILNGDLFQIEESSASFAAGVSYLSDKQKTFFNDTGDGETNNIGQRDIYSVFAEFVVPITNQLETDAAIRFDKYSDFGSSFNPKLSLKYTLNEHILFRASTGTGFKAPRFRRLYGKSSNGVTYFIDRKYCANNNISPCDEIEAPYSLSSNPNLKEEKSISYSLGTVIQPTADLSFSIDGWYTKVKNIITTADLEQVTKAEVNGINPSEYGVTITRDTDGSILGVDYKYANLAANEVAGADFNLEYNIPGFASDFGFVTVFNNDFSYMFYDHDEGFPGAGSRNVMGNFGKPYWKNKATLTFKNDIDNVDIVLRSIPGQNVQDENLNRKTSDLNEFDLNYFRKLNSKTQLGLGVKNIADAEQPADKGGGLANSVDTVQDSLYDINGRRFFMTYSQKF